ncbi:PAAR domain-containing protein [Marinobacter lacisalsi]|uniref:PAAR domain-containing protein n=1 Tax=Marinobacter lacisalsi TaxID=475979 RepID=A0ABV8QIC8_9GAMM
MSFLTSHHTCPKKRGKTPHKGGCVIEGSGNVFVGGMPVTTVGHKLVCDGPADTIAEGSPSVFVNGKPVARVGSMTVHGGKLVDGNPTVMVGDAGYVGTASGMQCLADLAEFEKLAIEEEQNPEPTDSRPPPYKSPTGLGAKPGASTPGQGAPAERIEEEEEEQEVPFEEWLHVEVLGENHPEGHSLKVMTREYGDIDVAVDGTHAEDKTDDSVIHKWLLKKDNEEYAAKVAVAMEIDTEEGDPIRLPVFDTPYAEAKKEPRQRYILAPFVPLTTIERQGTARKGVVTSRAGYLYIFRHDRLWREIQLVRDDNGELTYRDVPVDNYRDIPGDRLSEDRRESTGVALEEIWLPVRYLYSSLAFQQLDYRVAFSEVQWSAGRIHYMEHNVSDQMDRAQVAVDHRTNWNRYQAKLLPLSAQEDVPPQRAREPLLEEQIPCTYEFLISRSGNYAKECYEFARAEQQALMKGAEHAEQAWRQSRQEGSELGDSTGLRWAAFQDLWQAEKGQFDYAQSHQKVWSNIPAGKDVLNVPRQRKIYGLVVYDELHELRLQIARVNQAMQYQADIREWLTGQTHFDSAELIEQTILPSRLGGERNPLREFADKLDDRLNGTLLKTLHQHLRAVAVDCIKYNQATLRALAGKDHVQRRFADLFSLEGDDYLSGFMLAGGLFEKLQHDAEAADKPWLARTNRDGDTSLGALTLPTAAIDPHQDGSELVLDIVKDSSGYPLHDMLFPSDEVVSLTEALDTNALEDDKPGDGRFRPKLFADIGARESFSAPSTLQTAEARMLAELKDNEGTSGFGSARAIVQALDGIASMLMKEFNKAHERGTRDLMRFDLTLHGPLARAMKGMHPRQLGELVMMPYGQKPFNMVPFGIEDPDIGLRNGLLDAERAYVDSTNHSGRFFGQVSTLDGQQVAHTNPRRVPGGAAPGDYANVSVFMAPSGSTLVKDYREVREAASRSRAIGETLDAAGLPFVVMGIELWNVSTLAKRYDEYSRNRSDARAFAEAGSTYAHLGFALAAVVERMAGADNWLARGLNATVFDVEKAHIAGKISDDLAKFLPRAISVRMVSVSILGALDAGIRLSDTHDYWQKNQIASSAAMGVSALGSLMGTWAGASLMSSASGAGTAAILGLSTPAGWVVLSLGIALSLGGYFAATALEKPELEMWIEHGPFGLLHDDTPPREVPEGLSHRHRTNPADADPGKTYGHIRGQDNAREAFYRLVNILAGVTVTAEDFAVSDELAIATASNLLEARGEPATELAVSSMVESLMKINVRVRVKSNLAAVAGGEALEFDIRRLRAYSKVSFGGLGPSRGSEQWEIQSPPGDHWWVYEVARPDGAEYWLHSPEQPTVEDMKKSGEDEAFYWIVRARMKASLGTDTEYVFPAPALHDNLTYEDGKHGTPDFTEQKDFWVNQII